MTDAATMYQQVTPETGAGRVIEESLRSVHALQESLRRLNSEVVPEDVDLIEHAAPPGQKRRGRRRGRTKRSRTRKARAPTDPEPTPGPTAAAGGPDHGRDAQPGVLTACLDDERLLARDAVIAFAVHGPAGKRAREQLVQLRRSKSEPVTPRRQSKASRGNKRRGAEARGGRP